jgi:hypothetical protein
VNKLPASALFFSLCLVFTLLSQTVRADSIYVYSSGFWKIASMKCQNVTTGQEVTVINPPVVSSLYCQNAGLVSSAYDHVVITIDGTAEGDLPRPPGAYLGVHTLANVTINWGLISGVTSYRIYAAESPNVVVDPVNMIAEVTTDYFVHIFPDPAKTYYYVVTAVNSVGESAPSWEQERAPVNHSGYTQYCSGCHNGFYSIGKMAGHIRSTDACQNCHTYPSFRPVRVSHADVIGTCTSCHLQQKRPGHPSTTADCGTCHTTINWARIR